MGTLENRTYTKFQKHANNADEKVSAIHINTIQSATETNEGNIISLSNKTFKERVLFTFDNNLFVNAVCLYELDNKSNIDFSLSKNILYDNNKKEIRIDDSNTNAEVFTIKQHSSMGINIKLNDFFLIIDSIVPVGTSMKCYIINEKNEEYPILNESEKPCNFFKDITEFTIKAVMTKNAMGVSPEILSLAVMYFDEAVDKNLGLINPELTRFQASSLGITTLIRDRAYKDKLVKVINPDGETTLTYDEKERLSVIRDFAENQVGETSTTTETLNYGDYLNSKNITEEVLLTIKTEREV